MVEFELAMAKTEYDKAIKSLVAAVKASAKASQEREALLTILHEVDELIEGTVNLNRTGSTHWADCYKDHHDCLVVRIRAALDGES